MEMHCTEPGRGMTAGIAGLVRKKSALHKATSEALEFHEYQLHI